MDYSINGLSGRSSKRTGYFALSRTLTYSCLFVLPLVALYEILLLFYNQSMVFGIRNGADFIIKKILFSFGGVPGIVLGFLLLLILGVAIYYERKKYGQPIKLKYFGFMLLESIFYAAIFGLVIGTVTSVVLPGINVVLGSGITKVGPGLRLTLSLGAGIYEELLFRVILVSIFYGILYLIFKKWPSWTKYVVAALVSAFIFSVFHYIGPYGDSFSIYSFFFRFFSGLALNALYIYRGYGIAVWTHALYDIFITVNPLA
ncbi:MAG: CPBP family intramembrane metalloprotease [bacterium]|nr:CPBP family intramembrane metalloprotease [bacterium]